MSTADTHPDNHAEVRIRGPVPLDLAGTLLKAIGTLYPGTRIAPGRDGDALTLLIPDEDRPAAEGLDVGPPLEMIRLDPTGLTLGTPPELAATLARMAAETLGENPDAENYLEWTFHVPGDDDCRYVLTFARSTEQTPHELRLAAEKTLKAAQEENARLATRVAELEGAQGEQGLGV